MNSATVSTFVSTVAGGNGSLPCRTASLISLMNFGSHTDSASDRFFGLAPNASGIDMRYRTPFFEYWQYHGWSHFSFAHRFRSKHFLYTFPLLAMGHFLG